jgi:hypothetical protein
VAAIVAFGLSRSQLAVTGLLAALAVSLGSLVTYEWNAPAPAIAASPRTAEASNGAAPAPAFSPAPLTSFSAVTERPLFSPDRRPAPQASDTVGSWSGLTLAGIVVTPASREVLIAHGNPQKIVHLQEGQAVDGWVVRSIDPDRVVIANGGEQHELLFLGKHDDDRSASANPRRTTTPPR